LAYSGIREFTRALEQIEVAEEHGRHGRDVHIAMYAATLRARIAIDKQDFESAMRHTAVQWERPASAAMRAELSAYRCLAAACLGDLAQSEFLRSQVRAIKGLGVEAAALTACADAINAVGAERAEAEELSIQAFRAVESTGAFDCFVTAARGSPSFLTTLLGTDQYSTRIALILRESNDSRLANFVGLKLEGARRGPAGRLTPRELEVARLVARGHTNRMIGEALYISDSTVKVHVRHILDKLGARSRAELAARIATLD
jgi:DNA-binding NarL/FixJ family response regulator